MRVVEHSKSMLIIEDGFLPTRMASGTLLSVGLLLLVAGVLGLYHLWYVQLAGVVLAGAGFLSFIGTEVHSCRIDKSVGRIVIKRRRLLIPKVVNYPLRKIVGVELRQSSKLDTPMYQVNLVSSGGKRLPVSAPDTTARRKKQDAVHRISEFLNVKASFRKESEPKSDE